MKPNAVCKFCGQYIAACDVPEKASKQEAIEIGTLACNCHEAREYQMKRTCAEKAKNKLDEILVTIDRNHNIKGVDESIINHLKDGINLLVDDKATSITVDLGDVGTIKIAASGGKVTVQRSITLKEQA